ncbi:MAG: glycogen synthase GlgA [Rubrimonas sp.]
MKVLFAVSECAPFVKTGGLADVAGALPKALAHHGVAARVLLPAYPALAPIVRSAETLAETEDGRLIAAQAEGLDLILLDAPQHFDRPGGPYLGPDGRDWPDNARRFAALARTAARLSIDGAAGWRPDVLHLHDWQAALAAAYARLWGGAPPVVLTIHNIAFQGVFDAGLAAELGLPAQGFTPAGYEYYGRIGFLKAGLAYADRITTVSPTYARELTSPAFGMGLEGMIAARRGALFGILNGVDADVWNPETDPLIAQTFSARAIARRAANRAALADRFGLSHGSEAPLFGVVSRLTRQKGLDLLLAGLDRLLARGAALALLGAGDADLETAFMAAAAAHPGRVGAVIGYDERLAHLIQAGCDVLLAPSRFEPCGLTQLYALRYGALPLVGRTGGLADTVIDANEAAIAAGVATGFQFSPITETALADALDRACDAWADQALWRRMQRNAMACDVSWTASAGRYAALYADMTSG